jgi:transposase
MSSDKERILFLEEENRLLKEENANLRKIISKLENTIIVLTKRVDYLEEELRKTKLNKNSSNSSKPPSSDLYKPKRNQSLRKKSSKRSGGQPGHKGTTLEFQDNPDEIIELKPNYCNKCGCYLKNEEAHLHSRRQIIDIPPPVKPIITEYQQYYRQCPDCGHDQKSPYPTGVDNYIQYGSNIEAIISYLSTYQYLPYKRLQELLLNLFNLTLSQGTIDNILNRMYRKALPIHEGIKQSVSRSNCIGSDETSVKVNGKKWWVWVWQSVNDTYISCSDNRGSKTIDSLFPEGFKNSILCTDRYAAQLKTESKGHQVCVAHLLRDLNFIEELDKTDWAKRFKQLLKRALTLKMSQSEYSREDPKVMELEHDLEELLQEDIHRTKYKKTHTLQKSLQKERDSLLTFLYHKEVTADNNASERAVRNVKVKQKVSGQFKSNHNIFCSLRSIIDTCLKREVDVMFALKSISRLSYG